MLVEYREIKESKIKPNYSVTPVKEKPKVIAPKPKKEKDISYQESYKNG